MHSRKAFQCLIAVASSLKPQDLKRFMSDNKLPVLKDKWLRNLAVPNVHVGIHFPLFTTEYGPLMNCNVLSGEQKHRIYKAWADRASPRNLMTYLFRMDRIRQSLRLGFSGAWDYSFSIQVQSISKLCQLCPWLLNHHILPNECDSIIEDKFLRCFH
ncbi:hypothetical protein BO71DRAFT_251203 [Aspergillus ellipticus CBS 707.79]|uniref:Uncharacterized protein n=1 Tax=Aspergillus ellipticus CBS 707.79 TaxID=1448320 RepID=A0A319DQZ1_9EURO|nr:hypothetical protein BO71DRAFT_251203 [Aspergillus ellipticus CBS 707.79]